MLVRIANSLQVRYYQHEVPTDYQQRPWAAKVIQNTTVITDLACLMYGLYIGPGPFVIYIVCKMVLGHRDFGLGVRSFEAVIK
jgi:hypothetical protein